jgi:hypothetical protein
MRTWPGSSDDPPNRAAQCVVSAASRKVKSRGGGSASAAAMGSRRPGHAAAQRAVVSAGRVGADGSPTGRLSNVENTPCASRLGPPDSSGSPVASTAWGGVLSRRA